MVTLKIFWGWRCGGDELHYPPPNVCICSSPLSSDQYLSLLPLHKDSKRGSESLNTKNNVSLSHTCWLILVCINWRWTEIPEWKVQLWKAELSAQLNKVWRGSLEGRKVVKPTPEQETCYKMRSRDPMSEDNIYLFLLSLQLITNVIHKMYTLFHRRRPAQLLCAQLALIRSCKSGYNHLKKEEHAIRHTKCKGV